jgi:hypothetical protein
LLLVVKDVLSTTRDRKNPVVGNVASDGHASNGSVPMQYEVTAVGLDPHKGVVIAGPRTERMDPATNAAFEGCEGLWKIEDIYEAYWNRINDSWERAFPPGKDKVKVLRVEQVL